MIKKNHLVKYIKHGCKCLQLLFDFTALNIFHCIVYDSIRTGQAFMKTRNNFNFIVPYTTMNVCQGFAG